MESKFRWVESKFKCPERRVLVAFSILLAVLAASRMCHTGILWEGDTLPLATAQQMLRGHVIYRDIWFDKPPLLPAFYLLWGARDGWTLRLADALYGLLACWFAYLLGRNLWSRGEGLWAAGLLGFFLTFDFPSAAIPVASDLLMVAPHVAAVWLAVSKRPFWSGVAAGVAFWISPKGLLVAAICAVWNPAGLPYLVAGFGAVGGAMVAWLWSCGALAPYWNEVWRWGRLYAGSPFVEDPWRNGIARTANWLGFHIGVVVGAAWFLWRVRDRRVVWMAWLTIAIIGVAAGLRFFPRYYFLLLPPLVLMAARGFILLGRKRGLLALLPLLIPVIRFSPTYVTALTNPVWRDTGMDRDSRAAAALIRQFAKPGDTLFVWGYRPEIYVYSGLPAATMFLDSQPLTGVPADRHLTQSEPVETVEAGRRRVDLAGSRPTFVVDGLSPFNPKLAIANYPELRGWIAGYREVARSGESVVYRLTAAREHAASPAVAH